VKRRFVTVDVWDTVLRRRVHPEHIKLATARYLSLLPQLSFKPGLNDMWTLYVERVAAEQHVASLQVQSHNDDEYEISEVFSEWLSRTLALEPPSSLIAKLEEYEINNECKLSYHDPEISRFLSGYECDLRLYLSDFYLSSQKFDRILAHHGAKNLFCGGVVSCDLKLNKRSGRIYSHLHARHQIRPQEHTHIGDNLHSDVSVPRKLGIEAVHYAPAAESAKRSKQETLWRDRSSLFRELSSECESSAPPVPSSLYSLGFRSAPLFIGFVLFVAERSLSDQVKRLFFFTREGEFFLKVWQHLFPQNQLCSIDLPRAKLLEVSRIATFGPSLARLDQDNLMRVWRLFRTQSAETMIRSIGLDPSDFHEHVSRCGLSMDEPIAEPWKDQRLNTLLGYAEFADAAERKLRADRGVLLDYLEQSSWGEHNRVGIVDIGWRGTIQDNLALLSPRHTVHGYYLALQKFLNPQPENVHKISFGPNVNASSERKHFLDAVSPMEMMCNSPGGSVTGYKRMPTGEIGAKRLTDARESETYEVFAAEFQRGVCDAAAAWSENIECYSITSAELREPALRIWEKLISNPPDQLIEAYSELNHNELFGVGAMVDKRAVPSLPDIFLAVLKPSKMRNLVSFVALTQWPAGVWARKDIGLVHRTVLLLMIRAGLVYKGIRYALRG
jgi:predicted HAD superfamily hydrolase